MNQRAQLFRRTEELICRGLNELANRCPAGSAYGFAGSLGGSVT